LPPPVAQAKPQPQQHPAVKTYVARKGDTLASIARKSGGCSVQAIGAANGLRAPHYSLKTGQTLKLTGC
jgi:membrane-bound lytic murein transglycosylase D